MIQQKNGNSLTYSSSTTMAEREVQEEKERENYANRQKVRVTREKLKLMKKERRLTCWVAGLKALHEHVDECLNHKESGKTIRKGGKEKGNEKNPDSIYMKSKRTANLPRCTVKVTVP